MFKIHLSNLSWYNRHELDLFVPKILNFQNTLYTTGKMPLLLYYRAMNVIRVRFDHRYSTRTVTSQVM